MFTYNQHVLIADVRDVVHYFGSIQDMPDNEIPCISSLPAVLFGEQLR